MKLKNGVLFLMMFSAHISCAGIELIEELPPVVRVESDLGTLNVDPFSNTKEGREFRNNLREQIREHLVDYADVVEVSWLEKLNGPEIPMKLIYDKRAMTLKQINSRTNEVKTYNNVGCFGLLDFFPSGRISFDQDGLESYCRKFSFEWAPYTPKPEQDQETGNVKIVCDYVNTIVADSSSVKYLEWSAVTSVASDWYVRAKFSYNDVSGDETTRNLGFFINDSKVSKTIELK